MPLRPRLIYIVQSDHAWSSLLVYTNFLYLKIDCRKLYNESLTLLVIKFVHVYFC